MLQRSCVAIIVVNTPYQVSKDRNSLTKRLTPGQANKRHEHYCRMKGKVPSRTKSCLPCIKAKARCESEGKTCTRCPKRCITCHFESAVRGHVAIPVEDRVVDYDGTWMGSGIPFLTTPDDIDRGLIGQSTSSLQLPVENAVHHFDFSKPEFAFPINSSAFASIDDVWGLQPGADPLLPFHQLMSGTSNSPKLFESMPPKKREWAAASVVATRILRSYPDMMLQRATFPPFIHPRANEAETERSLPKALANAMSIAQMFRRRSPESRNFIWQSIQTEQQRMMSEVSRRGSIAVRNIDAAINAAALEHYHVAG